MAAEAHAAARLQHGEDHGEAVRVPADDGAARRAEAGRFGDERLHLDEQRPRALDAGEDGGAGRLVDSRSPMKSSEGLATSFSPASRHLEDADLGGRPEAVLHRAQQAEMVAGVALEIEHGVDHVLDHPRARRSARPW